MILQNSKIDYYPQSDVFSEKSDSVNFLPLGHSNFVCNFRKILQAILEKKCLPTAVLTY